ncbi:MAG: hypothetical protein WAW00_01835 [Candidatus Moraniibacteriota bacterium]
MGLFFSSKKTTGTPLSSKPGMSSGLNKNGVVTSREFKHKVAPALTKAFGRKRGAGIENALVGDMDHSGGIGRGMTAREATETLRNLERNKRDDISGGDIEKLKGIINSQL